MSRPLAHIRSTGIFLALLAIILILSNIADFFVVDKVPQNFMQLGQSLLFVKVKAVTKFVLALTLAIGSIQLFNKKSSAVPLLTLASAGALLVAIIESVVTYQATNNTVYLQLLFFPALFYGFILWYVHSKKAKHDLH